MLKGRMRRLTTILFIGTSLPLAGCGSKFSAEGAAGAAGALATGCADGTREGYDGETRIAACSGAFDVPGIVTSASRSPACGRQAGNDGANASGAGCSAADLCSAGFHVCTGGAEVGASASTGACPPDAGTAFFLTQQATDDNGECMPGGANNLVGCGSAMGVAANTTCSPLDIELRYTHCQASSAWECGTSADANFEATLVTKVSSSEGGVLCCSD